MVPTKRSAMALARGARTGVRMIWIPLQVKDGVEGCGEPGVAIADEEPEPPAGIVEVHGEVAGQLGQPSAGRVRGDAEDVHAAGGVLNDK